MKNFKELYASELIDILDTLIKNKIIFERYNKINNFLEVKEKLNLIDNILFKSIDKKTKEEFYCFIRFEKDFNILLEEKKQQEQLTDKINDVKLFLKEEFKDYLLKKGIYIRILEEIIGEEE